MLFARRLGFSGTPSALLPVEFGQCHYEKGADGRVLHTLTSEAVVSAHALGADWSVEAVLAHVADPGAAAAEAAGGGGARWYARPTGRARPRGFCTWLR